MNTFPVADQVLLPAPAWLLNVLHGTGLDFLNRLTAANWPAIDLFLVLVVTAVVVIAWLASVSGKAKRGEARFA